MHKDVNPWEGQSHTNGNGYSRQFFNAAAPVTRSRNVLDIDIRRVFRIWPLVIVFGLLGIVAAKLMLRYTVPVYRASLSVNIQQKEEISLGQAFFGTRDPFNDKLAWFRSPSIAKEVIEKLSLRFVAVQKGVFKDKDLYGILKWTILNTDSISQSSRLAFTIMPEADGFKLIQDKLEIKGAWNKPILVGTTPVIIWKYGSVSPGKEIICTALDTWQHAFALTRSLQINSVKESNIIDISYSDISPQRAVDVLTSVVEIYNNSMVSEKERAFAKAISFIDTRLGPLNRELDSIENVTSSFKSNRGFTGISSNGSLYQQKMLEADKQLVDIRLQKQTVQATEDYLNNPNAKDEYISLVGISDSYLQSLLIQFQKLRTDRINLAQLVTENNEDLKELDKQISAIRANIVLQVGNYKRNIQLSENSYQSLLETSKQLIASTPQDEKVLIDQERQENIKEQMFLMLLQKREEAAIAKASVTVDTKVLKPAIVPTEPVSPDRGRILISFVLAAAIIPLIVALIAELMNRKIVSRNQLERIIEAPVLAELEYDKKASKNSVLMGYGDRTMFSEQIRSLRANLGFYAKPDRPLTIMITSSMSGEGKSFISSNLARSFSMLGKKTALVEMDLRRPNLSKRFNVPNINGLSKVFAGMLNPQDIKVSLLESETLDLFPSGVLPPNPSELISNNFTDEFMKYLRSNYEVIIIDTPPYGIVSDAQLLAKWCDVTLVITRFNMTVVEQVKDIQRWNQQKIFPSMAIVFNAIKTSGYYGYNYGYYYYKKRKGYNYYTPSSVKTGENQLEES